MKRSRPIFLSLLCLVGMVSLLPAAEAPTYEHDVAPILRKYCVGCHGEAEPEGEQSLHSFEALQERTSEVPLIDKQHPEKSRLLTVMTGATEPRMPPEDELAPSEKEVALIKAWLASGMKRSEKPESAWKLDVPSIPSQSAVRPLSALAVSPDGKELALGSYGKVELFSLNEAGAFDRTNPGQVIEKLPGKITAIHFSSDGQQLAIATGVTGLAGDALLIDRKTGEVVRSFQGHTDILYDAEISPDGKLLATCGYDRLITIWDLATGEKKHELKGHNGAVYDVGFSPDSRFLVSASADDTCKVWRVADGVRLDTLPQPLKEVYTCAFSPDGKTIVCGGADNNLRVWQFVAQHGPKINPMIYARFAHEGPVQRIAFNEDGTKLFSVGNDLTIKLWDTTTYSELKLWANRPEIAMAAGYAPQTHSLYLGRLDGEVDRLTWSPDELATANSATSHAVTTVPIPASNMGSIAEQEPNDSIENAQVVSFPAKITGKIAGEAPGPDVDFYRFTAKAGQAWVLEINAARSKSPLDSHLSIYHVDGSPVERIKLQATRESYFTFRGKDDSISDDFRVFIWEEMKLNEYLYSNGEVARLWLHPRGPDSGFRVYPGQGKRWGYFDTTPLAHALGEPCYVVEPLAPGQEVLPNGLPVFTLYYENDDESRRTMGDDSRLFFTAPADGDYLVKVRDVRDFEGDNFTYELIARPRKEDFHVDLATKDLNVAAGGAREILFRCSRSDNFDGEIRIDISGLPEGFTATTPITIEPGQIEASGVIQATSSTATVAEDVVKQIKIQATAMPEGQEVTHEVAGFKKIDVRKTPKLAIRIEPAEGGAQPLPSTEEGPLEFEVHAGETIMLKVVAQRNELNGNIDFGKEGSGRNLPFAVNVANLGLNGLLMMDGQDEREFFITADEVAEPTSRLFHLKTGVDGGHATAPVLLHVLPK
ncbi:c-type cytochrome domain-containing protein [Blastopirellula marina]|uniref:Cytochrome C Planctomycete-type domain-containing protein n=1 Tax=Blastopirellula marina TaxID=124 RepID=A0A2S8G9J6_9BACT|nr:c-type cytochrome domain-containing protein [Blastopirellula marina]PQO41135.1 hypothetical protein C5Y98_04050 [Blastopirellula marina]PTL46011.1 hypothetical protein C5Y97_04050 [Blastopirellula marina]